jgi:peptidoglycan/xylan/chitin deacetylase (PgdA/CDA1 family)
MRGRLTFIALMAFALAVLPAGGGARALESWASVRDSASDGARPEVAQASQIQRAALPTGCTRGGPPFRTHGLDGKKRIAIGFDDGPSDWTPKVLRVLRENDSHATFFEIGQETAGRAEIMHKVLAQGNEIGNHTLHHEMNPSSGSLAETNRLIRQATGFRPCDFRPPDGRVNQGLVERAKAERLETIDWDIDPRDWTDPGVGAIASNVIRHAHNGSIVVMHDGGGDRSQTIAALAEILPKLRHRGYTFVTVAEVLGHHFIY